MKPFQEIRGQGSGIREKAKGKFFRFLFSFTLLILFVYLPIPDPRSPIPSLFAASSINRIVIRTSDNSIFKGSLEDKDGNLVSIRTDEGEELNLPVEEISAINGIAPSVFFKKYIPAIPDSLFVPVDLAANNAKVRMNFKFLASWNKSKVTNGFLFSGPDDDRRWDGLRFTVTLESPLKIDPSYRSVLKKVSDGGTAVLSETYEIVLGTETLRTTEMAKGNLALRTLRQIRVVNGEKCLLDLILSHQTKERLNRPMAIALFEKVVASIQFPPPHIQGK